MKKYIKKLNDKERSIIEQGNTEMPFSGELYENRENGIYLCRRCGEPLYLSEHKFKCNCGWPSFDDEIESSVRRLPDRDGVRTEIRCKNCNAHLGHLFRGEKLTHKNIRHCVNSASLTFIDMKDLKRALFSGGCFWGLEHLLIDLPGVINTTCGYCGGKSENPTYEEVCDENTGHAETVEVLFDPAEISFEDLATFFFEIHDPTQLNRQGPDIGDQYRSAVFCTEESQKETVIKLMEMLKEKGISPVTEVKDEMPFWPAERYHQRYYKRTGKAPYCHSHRKLF